jgi:hypothetical protein
LLALKLILDVYFNITSDRFSSVFDLSAFLKYVWSRLNLLIECSDKEGFSSILMDTFKWLWSEPLGVADYDLV